jgi:plastocyanin
MTTRTLLSAAVAALALTGLAGCGGSSDATADPAPSSLSSATQPASAPGTATTPRSSQAPAPEAAMITIANFAFGDPVSVSPGATVMVMNSDPETHSVTADTGDAFDVTVEAGASATFKAPDEPGSYAYHCSFHSDMHGMLSVR